MELHIDLNVPPPPPTGAGNRSLAARAIFMLATSPVGASIFVPGMNEYARGNLRNYLRGKYPGHWFTARTVEGGIRIWKIAEPDA